MIRRAVKTGPRAAVRVAAPLLPRGGQRGLTQGERAIAREMFGDALDLDRVRIHRRRFFPFQPKTLAVAPNGGVYFHPDAYRDDFSKESLMKRAWLVHELAHVMQHQRGMLVWLRALFDRRYDYRLDGRPFEGYGVEQQASLFEHAYLMRHGVRFGHVSVDACDAVLAPVRGGSCELRGTG